MPLITEGYRRLQRDLHRRYEYDIGNSVPEALQLVRVLRPSERPVRLLDYGSGRGTLKRAIEADPVLAEMIQVWEYDPTVKGCDIPPDRGSHFVACLNVLDHVEPECLDDVLAHMALCTLETCIMVISMRTSSRIMKDGRQAHICLLPAEEWRAALERHFTVGLFWDRTRTSGDLLVLGGPHAKK
jgi:hypothetical protein